MTDQYGRGMPSGRALTVVVVMLAALVGGPPAVAEPSRATPSPTPAVRTTPAVQSSFALADKRITKPTGLAISSLHPGVLWLVSGRALFAVTTSGRTVGSYAFSGPAPVAFEALAMSKDDRGRPLLLLADTGDPRRSRNQGVWLYTVREPDRLGAGTLRPQRYRLEYPDGPQNVRTLLVDPNDQRVYLVSMLSTGGTVYALPAAMGVGMSNVLTKIYPLHFVAQDGGFLPDGRVLLRGLNQAHLLAGIGGKRLAYLQLPRQANGPVAVVPGGEYILAVGSAPHSRVWRLKMPDIAAPTPAPTHNGPTVRPVPMSTHGTLSGRAVGMAALAGLLAIAILGSVLHLRRRSRAREPRRPPV